MFVRQELFESDLHLYLLCHRLALAYLPLMTFLFASPQHLYLGQARLVQKGPFLLHADMLVIQQPHLVLPSLLDIMDDLGLFLQNFLLFDLPLKLCLHFFL